MRFLLAALALILPSSTAFAVCTSTIPGPGYVNGQFVTCAALRAADLNAFSADMLGLIQQVQAQIPVNGATAANQTNGGQKTQIVDGAGNVVNTTGGNVFTNLRNSGGTEVGTAQNPLQVSPLPSAYSPQQLNVSTITTAGVSYVAFTSGQHVKGGWIRNCNASGTMYVNDSGTATQTEAGGNAPIAPGTNGTGGLFYIYPGTTTIAVTGSVNGMTICGEGYN